MQSETNANNLLAEQEQRIIGGITPTIIINDDQISINPVEEQDCSAPLPKWLIENFFNYTGILVK